MSAINTFLLIRSNLEEEGSALAHTDRSMEQLV